MKKVLIAYCTNSGTTLDVADMISEELQKAGLQVEVRQVDEVTEFQSYAGVILGAPMILGWHSSAVHFLQQHREALNKLPVALFATAMRLTHQDIANNESVPVYLDEKLAIPARTAGRLSFKERYTSETRYRNVLLKAAGKVKPVSIAFLGGRLEYYRLKWWQVLFVLIVIRAQPENLHNANAIRAWIDSLTQYFN